MAIDTDGHSAGLLHVESGDPAMIGRALDPSSGLAHLEQAAAAHLRAAKG